jgi:DMSO reductase family type II enzyme chaperone
MELANLHSEAEQGAASRSRVYQLLAAAFVFPDEEWYAALVDGTFATAVDEARRALPYSLGNVETPGAQPPGSTYIDFQSEYVRLFDVGAAGPPCPLYGGSYLGDRMKVMEEAIRFYNYFQLKLSSTQRELPDHITTELEFLHYLTFREAEARQGGADPSSLLRAERDFLARHLCKWVPRMQARLAKQKTDPFFPTLVHFAASFFEADRAYAAATTN